MTSMSTETQTRGSRRIVRIAGVASLVAAAALAVASVLPAPRAAKVKIVPPQSSGAGLGSLLGSAGGLASLAPLLGSRQPTEVFLAVARSHEVALDVLRKVGKLAPDASAVQAATEVRDLRAMTDINALKGGLIEFQATGTGDDDLVRIATAFADVFGERIKSMSLEEASRKEELIQDQLKRATERLVRAQEAMRVFRVSKKLVAPESIVGSAIALATNLRARLMAREVERDTLAQLVTPQHAQYKSVVAEIAELRRQVGAVESETQRDGLNYGQLSSDTTEYITLLREQRYAEALFEVFSRYHESLLLEQAAAGLNAQIVEAPHLDPSRRVRWPLAVASAALLLAGAWLLLQGRKPSQPI
jgi:hypothetical protein